MKTKIIQFLILTFLFVYVENLTAQNNECPVLVTQTQIDYMQATQAAREAIDLSNFSNMLHTIPVQAHIIRNNNGVGGISMSEIEAAMVIVNQRYAPNNMFFEMCAAPNYIDSDALYYFGFGPNSTTEVGMAIANQVANVVNVYFAPNLSYCGWAYFPSAQAFGRDWIVMNNICVNNGSTFAHEFGHYFNLYHTHSTAGGAENVTRNGNSSCHNCSTAGDGLCDTPADPVLGCFANVNSVTCNYTRNATDNCGQTYTPPTTNIMSYSCKHCRTDFTQGQLDRILTSYLYDRAYLDASICANTSCIANHNLQSPNDDISTGTTIKYEASNTITATNIIQNGADAIYDAANEITLNAGFSAESGATALMVIEGCGGVYKTSENTNSGINELVEEIAFQTYPNPFSSTSTIEFELPTATAVYVQIYNSSGQLIAALANGETYNSGKHQLNFDANDLPIGMYICQLKINNEVQTKKMLLMR